MSITHAFREGEENVVETYVRTHANGEQTYVYLVSCGDQYSAIAIDVAPREIQPIASYLIATKGTLKRTRREAEIWMEDNAKGIAPEDSDSGGFLGRIVGALSALDQSAKDGMADETEET